LPLSASEAVSPAIEHAKKQLFQPFRLGQWMRLALIGFLTGELGSSGGCNAPTGFPSSHGSDGAPNIDAGFQKIIDFWHAHPALIAGIITSVVVFFLLFGVVMTYLNSRMRFVLFDSIIARECRISEFWSRRREVAWRYFIWQILFGFGSWMAFVILIGIPVGIAWVTGWLRKPSAHVLPLVLGGVVIFFVFLVLAICLKVFLVITKDFVVPYMAVEDLSVMDGWRRVWGNMKSEKAGYAGYLGMKIVLAIAAGILFGIMGFFVILIVAIPLVIIGVLVGVIAAGAGLAWNPFTITLAVVAGMVCFLLIFFLALLISVPVALFFPAYSIHFLASRYPKLDALLHPAPPMPPVPPAPRIPPLMPPFLPPEPNALGS
jgi:hypothetical protein